MSVTSAEEEDFGDTAFFGEGLAFGGLVEGEHAGYGDFEVACEDVFGEGAEGWGVGGGSDEGDLDGGVHGGVGGGSGDGGEDTAGFDLGEEEFGGGAAYGVGDCVDEAEALHGGSVVEGEDDVGAEGFGFLELGFAYAGDDGGSGLFGGPDGGAAYAADGSGYEDGLAGLDFGAEGDELAAGDGDEGEGGGFDEVQAFGEERKVRGFDDG